MCYDNAWRCEARKLSQSNRTHAAAMSSNYLPADAHDVLQEHIAELAAPPSQNQKSEKQNRQKRRKSKLEAEAATRWRAAVLVLVPGQAYHFRSVAKLYI